MKSTHSKAENLIEAMQFLSTNKINFDKIGDHKIAFRPTTFESPFFHSIHIYFFNKQNQDVAYFTPCLKSVSIHPEPRDWDESMLEDITWMDAELLKVKREIAESSPCEKTYCPNFDDCHSDNPDFSKGCV